MYNQTGSILAGRLGYTLLSKMGYMEEIFDRTEHMFSNLDSMIKWLESFESAKNNSYTEDALLVREDLSSQKEIFEEIDNITSISKLNKYRDIANRISLKKPRSLSNSILDKKEEEINKSLLDNIENWGHSNKKVAVKRDKRGRFVSWKNI